jgi:hypothetical protein
MSSSLAGSRDPGCGRGFQPGRVAAACDQLQLLRQQLVSATQEVNVMRQENINMVNRSSFIVIAILLFALIICMMAHGKRYGHFTEPLSEITLLEIDRAKLLSENEKQKEDIKLLRSEIVGLNDRYSPR